MNGRTVIHRTLQGRQSNASTSMRIHLYQSITPDGDIFYHWSLDNDGTGHHWFTRISYAAFRRLSERLSANYRFVYKPVRRETPKSACILEDVYYI